MYLNVKEVLRNFTYSLSSNFITLVISTLVVLVVPKVIGIEQYGYWQLYLFYSSYVGFLHLGWIDGIYLRFGGEEYSKLDKNLFFSQFYSLATFQILFSACLLIYSFLFISDESRFFIFIMISADIIIYNLRGFLLLLLQATNNIKEYAQINIIDRIVYVSLIAILLLSGITDFKLLVASDIISKIVSLLYASFLCKDIVFFSGKKFRIYINEIILNISIGIKLMISNIANNLIIGIARFGIEINWDVATFGKVSLTLSVSNMFMTFINALGIVVYPVIRRVQHRKISFYYNSLRDMLMPVILFILMLYYPIKFFLSNWLPEYAESLEYMAILFPIIIYQSKMSLLLNPFLKALRQEKALLVINSISVFFSIALVTFFSFVLNNLELSILSIIISVTFRGIIAEIFISKIMNIDVLKDITLELLMTFIFILTAYFIDNWSIMLIYGLAFIVYLLFKMQDLNGTFIFIKKYLLKK